VSSRFISPVSGGELDRRAKAVREMMAREDIDALVMQNSNDWLGGYVRWFTGAPANNAYPRAVIFPREGAMSVVEQGAFGTITTPAPDDLSNHGVGRILHTPSYTSVAATQAYDAELAVGELRTMGARRVGWVNPAGAYFGFGRAVEALAQNVQFVDATDAVDALKAVKSAEEWICVEATTALQDGVMSAMADFIKPGMHDFEIASYAQYKSQQLGAEQGIFISSSSPSGQAAVFRPRHMQGRKLENGDVFALLVETNGPGGYYTEIGRTFVLGKAQPGVKKALQDAIDAQKYTLDGLKPGVTCESIFHRHNAYMQARGLPTEKRLYAHGQGYDMVERPIIRDDETMSIAQDMSIVVHPGYVNDEAFALICDNYRIGADGPGECLHRTPKTIFEL
jgi:Xaa-Pro aminopeptidase